MFSLSKIFSSEKPPLTCLPAKKLDKPVFVFDLHGVIFRLDKYKVIKELWKAPGKRYILLACLNPYFLYTALRLWLATIVLEDFILQMMDRFPIINSNRQAALKVANALKPIHPTIALIHQLHINRYPLYLFSNIGDRSLAMLNEQFPETFALFNGILGSHHENKYLAKPEPKAYLNFFTHFKLNPQQIIFVDDNPKNLIMAQQLKMNTVHVSEQKAIFAQIEPQL